MVFHQNTCTRQSLLKPCFKTGEKTPFPQHRKGAEAQGSQSAPIASSLWQTRHSPGAINPPRQAAGLPSPRGSTVHRNDAESSGRRIVQGPREGPPDTQRLEHWCLVVPRAQFQLLFNSLFKVVFIFPSQYLFAIGLLAVFSLMGSLPHTLRWNPNQRDS